MRVVVQHPRRWRACFARALAARVAPSALRDEDFAHLAGLRELSLERVTALTALSHLDKDPKWHGDSVPPREGFLWVTFPAAPLPSFGDAAFTHLVGLRALCIRGCSQPALTDAAFAPLAPSLERLDIAKCTQLTGGAFAHFTRLQRLELPFCSQPSIDNAALAQLENVRHLNLLGCSQATITDAAFAPLRRLESVVATGMQQLTAGALDVLAQGTGKALVLLKAHDPAPPAGDTVAVAPWGSPLAAPLLLRAHCPAQRVFARARFGGSLPAPTAGLRPVLQWSLSLDCPRDDSFYSFSDRADGAPMLGQVYRNGPWSDIGLTCFSAVRPLPPPLRSNGALAWPGIVSDGGYSAHKMYGVFDGVHFLPHSSRFVEDVSSLVRGRGEYSCFSSFGGWEFLTKKERETVDFLDHRENPDSELLRTIFVAKVLANLDIELFGEWRGKDEGRIFRDELELRTYDFSRLNEPPVGTTYRQDEEFIFGWLGFERGNGMQDSVKTLLDDCVSLGIVCDGGELYLEPLSAWTQGELEGGEPPPAAGNKRAREEAHSPRVYLPGGGQRL